MAKALTDTKNFGICFALWGPAFLFDLSGFNTSENHKTGSSFKKLKINFKIYNI
jgi:hypothetical protein